jgi:hypothetical protein
MYEATVPVCLNTHTTVLLKTTSLSKVGKRRDFDFRFLVLM